MNDAELDAIEPVNLLEEGFNDSIQVGSMQDDEGDSPDDDGPSEQELEALVDSEPESEEDETKEAEGGEREDVADTETNASGIDPEKTYDLGDGQTISGKEVVNRLKTENKIRQQFGEIAQKTHDLTKREAKLNTDLQVVSTHLNNLSKSENKLEAIKNLVSATGVDANEWFAQLAEEIQPQIEQMNSMSEPERELMNKQAKIQQLEAQLNKTKESQSTAQYQAQLKSQVEQALVQNGLTGEDFGEAYQKVVGAVQQGQLQELKNADEKTALAAVVDFAINNKALDKIDSVLDKVDPALKNNDEVVKQLYSVLRNPYRQYDVSDEDLEEIVRTSFGDVAKGDTPAQAPGKKKVKVISQEAPVVDEEDPLSGIEEMSADDLQFL